MDSEMRIVNPPRGFIKGSGMKFCKSIKLRLKKPEEVQSVQ